MCFMKITRNLKETKHEYKGFTIIGTQYKTSGGWVLGGRFFIEGGIARNYNILKDGKYVFNPNCLITTLASAKEEIDEYIRNH